MCVSKKNRRFRSQIVSDREIVRIFVDESGRYIRIILLDILQLGIFILH